MLKTKHTLMLLLKSLPYLALVIALMASGHAFADGTGTDYLKGADTAVAYTFGAKSVFLKLLYVAEAIVLTFTWIKTKSPMALIGLPVLMIATHFIFGVMIPGATT